MVKILTLLALAATVYRSKWLSYSVLTEFCSGHYVGCLWNQKPGNLFAIFAALCVHLILTAYDFSPKAHKIEWDAIKIIVCSSFALILEESLLFVILVESARPVLLVLLYMKGKARTNLFVATYMNRPFSTPDRDSPRRKTFNDTPDLSLLGLDDVFLAKRFSDPRLLEPVMAHVVNSMSNSLAHQFNRPN